MSLSPVTLTCREQVEQGGALCLVQEPTIPDFATRGKPYSQILAVTLRHNKKYLNQSRANAFNNPPMSQESFQKCAPGCIRLSTGQRAHRLAHLLVWSPLPLGLQQGVNVFCRVFRFTIVPTSHFIHFPYFPFPPLLPFSLHFESLLSIMGLLQESEKRNVRKFKFISIKEN